MKQFYLITLALFVSSLCTAQVLNDDFSSWSGGIPDSWMGSKSNLLPDSVVQTADGATFGPYLAELTNEEGGHRRFTSQAISLTEGSVYEVEVWLKGTADVRVGLFDGDLDGADFGYSYNSYVAIDDTQVTSFIQVIQPDTTSQVAELIISFRNGIIEMDRVEVREGELPEPTAVSIFEIQMTSNIDGSSELTGQYVVTTGVVTAVAEGNMDYGYWIQNGTGPWSGIHVKDLTNVPAIGESVEVTGTVEEFFGDTRINNVSAFVNNGASTPVSPLSVGTAALNDEQFEGVLVSGTGAAQTELDSFNEWLLSDGSGDIVVNDVMFLYAPIVGTNYTVNGPLVFAFGTYRIEPRDGDVFTGLQELSDLGVSIFPNPVTEVLNIQRESAEPMRVQLFEMNGKMILDEVVTGNLASINLAPYADANYVLVVTTGNETAATQLQIRK